MTNRNRIHKYLFIFTISIIVLSLLLPSCGNEEVKEKPVTHEEAGEAAEEAASVVETGEEEAENTPVETVKEEAVEESPAGAVFIAETPVSTFSEEDIAYLGVVCSGIDEEIAGCIKQWQEVNMIYASPGKGYNDAADPIHWNHFLPGIWSSKDIIYAHTDNGKIYGICHDFAIIYCSIADYYGLECRVMNTISKPGDSESQSGMLREEYERNKAKLDENGLDYSYAAVNTVAEGTPTHYWAEVYLNGEWVPVDGSQAATGGNTENEFIATNDFEVTDWLSQDKSALLESYSYEGMTDDLGHSGRAANMGDVLQGIAFAPYFNDAQAACDFVGAGDNISETDLMEAMEDKEAYESCSGNTFNLVCYFICDGNDLEGTSWAECYERYSGEKLDIACVLDIIEGS